jgi:AcrR family transcriptional regulator
MPNKEVSQVHELDRMVEILEKATVLFAQRGFEVPTMEDLANVAGCTRRTLYRGFPNKEELFWRCFGRAVGLILDRQRLTMQVCESAKLPVRDYLVAWAGAYLDFAVDLPAEFRLVMEGRERAAAMGSDASGFRLSAESLAWLQSFQREVQVGVARLGKRLEDQGECKPGTGAGRLGEILVALLATVEFHARYRAGGKPLGKKEAEHLRLFLGELAHSINFETASASSGGKDMQ